MREILILLSFVQNSPFSGVEIKADMYEHPDLINEWIEEKYFTDIHPNKIEVRIANLCRYSKNLDIKITDVKVNSVYYSTIDGDGDAILPKITIGYSYAGIGSDVIGRTNGIAELTFKGEHNSDIKTHLENGEAMTSIRLYNFGNGKSADDSAEALTFSSKANIPSDWYEGEIMSQQNHPI